MIPTYIPTSAVQKEVFPLAGMLRVVKLFGGSEHVKNLSKLDTKVPNEASLTFNRVSNEAHLGVIAPTHQLTILKRISTADPQSVGPLKNECVRCLESVKNNLPIFRITVYGNSAPAKSGAGIGVLITCIVPTRTKRVFLSAKFLHTQIMVGWMRLPKGRPVSIQAGYANLVQLTTSLRLASLGGEFKIHCIEAAIWLPTLPQNRLLSGAFTLASNHAISLLPLALNPKPDLCYPIAHACLLLASIQEALMLKSYDVPANPVIYTKHLIALAQLTGDVLTNDSAPDTDFLLALAFSIETVARDLHCMLESNELPEVKA